MGKSKRTGAPAPPKHVNVYRLVFPSKVLPIGIKSIPVVVTRIEDGTTPNHIPQLTTNFSIAFCTDDVLHAHPLCPLAQSSSSSRFGRTVSVGEGHSFFQAFLSISVMFQYSRRFARNAIDPAPSSVWTNCVPYHRTIFWIHPSILPAILVLIKNQID